MVGRSFGRDLAEVCTVRRSLSQTIGSVQWAAPSGRTQLPIAQFGTKQTKRGAGGLGAFGPTPLSQVGRSYGRDLSWEGPVQMELVTWVQNLNATGLRPVGFAQWVEPTE